MLRTGEDHPNSKLTWGEVDLMRQLHEEYGLSAAEIARKLECPWSTVRDVVYYRAWLHYPARRRP